MNRVKLDDIPIALFLVDETFNIVGINAKAIEITGYKSTELIGSSVNMLVPEYVRSRHTSMMEGYKNNPTFVSLGVGRILEICCKNGDRIPVEISLMPIETTGFVVLISVIDVRASIAKSIFQNIKIISDKISGEEDVSNKV